MPIQIIWKSIILAFFLILAYLQLASVSTEENLSIPVIEQWIENMYLFVDVFALLLTSVIIVSHCHFNVQTTPRPLMKTKVSRFIQGSKG